MVDVTGNHEEDFENAESNNEEESDVTQEYFDNFDECEEEHNLAFIAFKRSSCFAHTF